MSSGPFYYSKEFADFCIGRSIYCQTGDSSKINAAVAALDAVSGQMWQAQFKEERRIDPAIGEARNLAELYRGYKKD